MDLYRLNDPLELEYLAIADLWLPDSVFLIEWPEHGLGMIPPATDIIELQPGVESNVRSIRHRRVNEAQHESV